jgi:hypothetical protein
MELVDNKKLEEVADFLTNIEVNGDYLCGSFLEFLNGSFNAPKCEDDEALCMENCPMKSIKAFIKWIKKPDSKYDVSDLKKPHQEDFIGYDNRSNSLLDKDGYIKALEEYCDNLEDVLADTEYDAECIECETRILDDKLEQIRGILDGHD